MERDRTKTVSYAFARDSFKYVMLCARSNICFVVGIMSRY